MSTSLKKATPGINEQLRLLTPTNIGSILNPNTTLININIRGMTLNISDPDRTLPASTDHVLSKSNQIPIFDQRQRLGEAVTIQQPTNSPGNIEVIKHKWQGQQACMAGMAPKTQHSGQFAEHQGQT